MFFFLTASIAAVFLVFFAHTDSKLYTYESGDALLTLEEGEFGIDMQLFRSK